MADPFETRLQRLFADPPVFSDADLFADRAQARLGQGRTLRQVMILGAGVLGGVVAVAQLLNANLEPVLGQAEAAAQAAPIRSSLAQPLADPRIGGLLDQAAAWLPTSSFGMEVVWTAAALAAAGVALLATRFIGER